MELSPTTMGLISAAIAVPVFFFAVRRINFFKRPSNTPEHVTYSETKYGKWEAMSSLLVLFFTTVIGLGLWKILSLLADLRKTQLLGSEFLIYDPSIMLALPSMAMAIMLAGIPLHFLYSYLLGPKHYAEYTHYINQKFRVNSSRLFFAVLLIVLPISIAFALLILNSYVQVTNSAIKVNPFFAISEREYTFSEIDFLEFSEKAVAPNGKIIHKPHYIVSFSDGFQINFSDSIHEPDIKDQKALVQYLSDQTNIEILVND